MTVQLQFLSRKKTFEARYRAGKMSGRKFKKGKSLPVIRVRSVPLRGVGHQMDADRLFRLFDIEPLSIGFPSWRDDLNQNHALRNEWRVRPAFLTGL